MSQSSLLKRLLVVVVAIVALAVLFAVLGFMWPQTGGGGTIEAP